MSNRVYNRVGNKFTGLTIDQKYDAYTRQYGKKTEKFSMREMYTKEEFTRAYNKLYNAYKDAGEKPVNVIRSIVQNQQMVTRDIARELKGTLGGKVSDYYKIKNNEEYKSYVGKLAYTTIRGVKYEYRLTENQAYFAYMHDLGLLDEAEEEWGY